MVSKGKLKYFEINLIKQILWPNADLDHGVKAQVEWQHGLVLDNEGLIFMLDVAACLVETVIFVKVLIPLLHRAISRHGAAVGITRLLGIEKGLGIVRGIVARVLVCDVAKPGILSGIIEAMVGPPHEWSGLGWAPSP